MKSTDIEHVRSTYRGDGAKIIRTDVCGGSYFTGLMTLPQFHGIGQLPEMAPHMVISHSLEEANAAHDAMVARMDAALLAIMAGGAQTIAAIFGDAAK